MKRALAWSLLFPLTAIACTEASTSTTTEFGPVRTNDDGASPNEGGGSSSSSSGSAGGKDADAGSSAGEDAGADAARDGAIACTTCASELVASDPQNSILYGAAWHISVDDTSVYIARNTAAKIASAPKAGGGTLTAYTLGHYGSILALAEAGSFLYYTRNGTDGVHVHKLPKTGGGAPVTLFSATSQNGFFDNLFVSGDALWFSSGEARRYDLVTGALTTVGPAGQFITANDTHLFWMWSSQLMAAPKDGSAVAVEIAFLGTIPRVIAAYGDEVYVGSEGEIEITKIKASAPHTETKLNTAVKVSESWADVTPKHVDGSYVYVASMYASPPGIYRVPTAGGPAVLFATDAEPMAVTGDATHIYWTNRDREVRRKAK